MSVSFTALQQNPQGELLARGSGGSSSAFGGRVGFGL